MELVKFGCNVFLLDIATDDGARNFLKENCQKNITCSSLRFKFEYMRNEKHQYFYYVTMSNLTSAQRKGIFLNKLTPL